MYSKVVLTFEFKDRIQRMTIQWQANEVLVIMGAILVLHKKKIDQSVFFHPKNVGSEFLINSFVLFSISTGMTSERKILSS